MNTFPGYAVVYAVTFGGMLDIGTAEYADYAAAKKFFDTIIASPKTVSAELVDAEDHTVETYNI